MSQVQRAQIAIAVTVSVIGTFAFLSILPSWRTGPGPVGKRLRKSKTEKPLPQALERIYIDGPDGGQLEIITNKFAREGSDELEAPLLLIHGGMGSARCYDKWATYFASKRRTVYSLSLRGHGKSHRPINFNTLSPADFTQDIAYATRFIKSRHSASPAPILIGHSAGGGLAQYAVSTLAPREFSALIALAPFPCTGGASVYLEWLKFDWLFFPRFMWQGCDAMSPLSTQALVKRAFFSDDFDDEELKEFFNQMNSEESPGWPAGMMGKFADPEVVKTKVDHKIHLISASHDRLMTPPIMKKLAETYGCSMDVVHGSGHHMMFDNQWKQAADYLEAKFTSWNL